MKLLLAIQTNICTFMDCHYSEGGVSERSVKEEGSEKGDMSERKSTILQKLPAKLIKAVLELLCDESVSQTLLFPAAMVEFVMW